MQTGVRCLPALQTRINRRFPSFRDISAKPGFEFVGRHPEHLLGTPFAALLERMGGCHEVKRKSISRRSR